MYHHMDCKTLEPCVGTMDAKVKSSLGQVINLCIKFCIFFTYAKRIYPDPTFARIFSVKESSKKVFFLSGPTTKAPPRA